VVTPQLANSTDFSAFNQGNNRIARSGFGYDVAGNLTGDPTGLTAVEIARRFGVHKSQTTRILHRVQEKMRAAVFMRLGTGVMKGRAGVGRLSVFDNSFRELSGTM